MDADSCECELFEYQIWVLFIREAQHKLLCWTKVEETNIKNITNHKEIQSFGVNQPYSSSMSDPQFGNNVFNLMTDRSYGKNMYVSTNEKSTISVGTAAIYSVCLSSRQHA